MTPFNKTMMVSTMVLGRGNAHNHMIHRILKVIIMRSRIGKNNLAFSTFCHESKTQRKIINWPANRKVNPVTDLLEADVLILWLERIPR